MLSYVLVSGNAFGGRWGCPGVISSGAMEGKVCSVAHYLSVWKGKSSARKPH